MKDYICDSLLNDFFIVFQRAYFFEDTIENNILFGKPQSTKEEMITVAKEVHFSVMYPHFRTDTKQRFGKGVQPFPTVRSSESLLYEQF